MIKCSISFGMVYIPVTLHNVIKSDDIGFNMLDKKTRSRVRYKKTCVECDGRELASADIIKGYEYAPDKYVVLSDDELEKLKTKKDKSVCIERFVLLDEIDPVYFDKSYYVMPQGADAAFALLRAALSKQKKVGIAKTMIGSREAVVCLRVHGNDMILNTMHFFAQVTANPARDIKAATDEKQLDMAVAIIENMSGKLDMEQYKNEYRERLESAIEAKLNGQEINSADSDAAAKISNLMDALKQTLESSGAKGKSAQTNKAVRRKSG